ncbi:hypothetical protein BASA81_011928 [Batrachochytrium salamandrivorans]|nr:hypothetical protein BASA81_011928 [Batrachochytrium salamandrivorans]
MQKSHGKGKPAPSGAFTHRIREDGEIFSGEEGRETSSDTTPLASVAGSVRMRSTDSDRSVRATPKKARDAAHHPRTICGWCEELSQQVLLSRPRWMLCATLALQQKATANLEKILNMASQQRQPVRRLNCSGCYLARLEVGPDVPKVVVVDNDYPPLPPTGATSKARLWLPSQTPLLLLLHYYYFYYTGHPQKHCLLMLSKGGPPHQQLVERQPEFRKAGAAAGSLERETSVPAHSAPKVELSSGLRLIMQADSLRKAWRPSKGNAGCPHPYSAVRDIRWIPSGCAATSRRRLCVCIYSHNHQSGRDHCQVL